MKVSYDEGVANHIGPESCVVARKGLGEALTGGMLMLNEMTDEQKREVLKYAEVQKRLADFEKAVNVEGKIDGGDRRKTKGQN